MKNTWTWIAVIGLILFGAFLYWGGERIFKPSPPQIKSDTVKITYDTTIFKDKLVVKYKDTGSVKWKDNLIFIPYYKATKEDTIRDYNAYHTPTFDKDTIVNDSNLFFELKYGILQSRLISADGRYFWKKPQTIINNSITNKPTNSLYIGTSFGANLRDGFIVTGNVSILTKKSQIWGVSVDYFPMLSKRPMFSIHHSIKIKF